MEKSWQRDSNELVPDWRETSKLLDRCGLINNSNGQPFKAKNTFLRSDISQICKVISKKLL